MQSTEILASLPLLQQHITQTTLAWRNHPEAQTLVDFHVGPRWRDFYLSEFDALVKQALPPDDPLRVQSVINNDAVIEPGVRFVLSNVNPNDHAEAVDNVLKRSVFAFGFHEVIAKATTIDAFFDEIEEAVKNDHPALSPLLQQNASFTLKFDVFQGSLHRAAQNEVRDRILSMIPNLSAKVQLNQPQHVYTVHIVCQLLDERLFSPELIKEQKILPFQFFLSKSLREKTPEQDFVNSFALNIRPYIGPTSCDPVLAFCMANLTQCSSNHQVFDPFTGTGSILVSCRKFSYVLGQDLDISTLFGLYRGKEAKQEEYEERNSQLVQEKAQRRVEKNQGKRQQQHQLEQSPRQEGDQQQQQQQPKPSQQQQQQQKQLPEHDRPNKHIKQKNTAQLRGLCKQKNFNIFDNFNHYNFSRPELICADSSHSPFRVYQYTGELAQAPNLPHLKPHCLPHTPVVNAMQGFTVYKTTKGKPTTSEDDAIHAQQSALEQNYVNQTLVPQKTKIINKYLLRYNKLVGNPSLNDDNDDDDETVLLEQIELENEAALQRFQIESEYHPIRPTIDIIACDPPYGIRARASKIGGSTSLQPISSNPPAAQSSPSPPPHQTPPQQPASAHNIEDSASYMSRVRTAARWKKDKFKSLAGYQSESNHHDTTQPPTPALHVDSQTPNQETDESTITTSPPTQSVKTRRLFNEEDIAIHRYIPETVHNPMQNVLYDLFHFSAQRLPIGGRVAYLLPTAKPYPRDLLPNHPCFTIKYACLQDLPTWFSRWLIVMEKTSEYHHEIHQDWIDQQLSLGVPIWSPSVSAHARVLAKCAHNFPVQLLYDAKAHIDMFGYDTSIDVDMQ